MTNEELAALPTTNYRSLIATRMLVATGVTVAGAFIHAVWAEHNAFAKEILDSWLFFFATVLGIGGAVYGVKRATDTDMRERVAKAKAGQGNGSAAVTGERPAMRPSQQVNVVMEGDPPT